MRWSQWYIPTLKEAPGDAEVISHKLLIRAGMIRKLTSGIYTWLPLGLRTRLVEPAEYGLPRGELVEGKAPETPWTGEAFEDEVLLLVNCTGPLLDKFLQGFRRNKIPPVALKAVLTPTNREWDSVALHAELCRERQAT